MARHVARNLQHADSSVSGSVFASHLLVTLRELFLAGGWSEVYKTNTAEWNNNILVSVSDCQVNSGTPYRIYSATGGFSALAKGMGFTLIDSSNDGNCRVMRILNVVDNNNIDVEPENAPPDGWTTATGLTGRGFNWGITDVLTTGTILIMGAPSGTLEVKFVNTTAYTYTASCYPDGYQSGAGHETDGSQVPANSSTSKWARINAYFDDPNGIIYYYEDSAGYRPVILFGTLDDVESGDIYPGFICAGQYELIYDTSTYSPTYLRMIDSTVLTTKYNGRFTDMVKDFSQLATSSYRFGYNLSARTVRGGKAILRKPWVYAGNAASSGFPRGRIPDIMRVTNSYWETMRPIDPATGSWFHLSNGFCVPLLGTTDKFPRRI